MKPPVFVGLGIGIILVGAMMVLPRWLPSAARAGATAARSVASAQKLLFEHDPLLSDALRRVDPDALREADAEQLVQRARQELEQIVRRSQAAAQQVQQQARQYGLNVASLPLIAANAASIRSLLDGVHQVGEENSQRLARAGQEARQAQAIVGRTHVHHMVGLVEYAKAADLLGQANALRLDQTRKLARAVYQARELRLLQAEMAHHKELSKPAALDELREALADMAARQTEVEGAVQRLEEEIQGREAEIVGLEQQIDAARQKLAAAQEGVPRGADDSALDRYRSQVRELGAAIGKLQDELHLLQLGGLRGATLTGRGSALDAVIEGGEPVHPLEILRQEKTLAAETAQRLTEGRRSLETQISRLEARSAQAAQREREIRSQADGLKAALRELFTATDKLATDAAALEQQAISAAQSSAGAFGSAGSTASKWKSDARDEQSRLDPNRQNPRLKLIQSDGSAEALGIGAQAEARRLVAVAWLQQLDALENLRAVAQECAALEIESGADLATIEESLSRIRADLTPLLNELAQTYQTTLANQLPPTIKGMAVASSAAVEQMLIRVDQSRETEHRNAAEQLINTALETLSKSPALGARLTTWRDSLLSRAAPSSGPTDAASKPTEGDDLFEDEKKPKGDDLFDDQGGG